MAVTTRRKPASGEIEQLRGEIEQLRGELAGTRAEIGELRTQLRAVAGLAFGIGVIRAPAGTNASVTTIRGVCQLYGVSGHAEAIAEILTGRKP